MSIQRMRLVLEVLDSRTMPSVSIASGLPFGAMAVVSHSADSLAGTATGHYIGNTLEVDAGTYDKLTGTANLVGRGSFALTGWLQGLGLIAHGHAGGQLVLSNAEGTITLSLRGPLQSGFSPIPSEFGYTISSGTGAYQHLAGHGTVAVRLLPAPTAFGLPPQGIFDLTFS